MSGTRREIATGLNRSQVVRLFKCAVKDDGTLVDVIVEKLYGIIETLMRDARKKRLS